MTVSYYLPAKFRFYSLIWKRLVSNGMLIWVKIFSPVLSPQCVSDSKDLPLATVNVIKDHPEMTDWIHPIQPYTPFYISNYNYTKIVVDRVQAADYTMHNVLLLATGR